MPIPTCFDCDKPHQEPVAAVDCCGTCTANLCRHCREAGCCGASPARSWFADLPPLPPVPRPARLQIRRDRVFDVATGAYRSLAS